MTSSPWPSSASSVQKVCRRTCGGPPVLGQAGPLGVGGDELVERPRDERLGRAVARERDEEVVGRGLGAALGPGSQRLDRHGREVNRPCAPALGMAHVDDPPRLLGRPGGECRPPTRVGVAAQLLEIFVSKRADLRAPQPGLAEQEHDREIAAPAAGPAVGHREQSPELRAGQGPRRPAADGVRSHPLGRRVDALCLEGGGEATQRPRAPWRPSPGHGRRPRGRRGSRAGTPR